LRLLRAQQDALLLHGTRGCASPSASTRLVEALADKESLLAGLVARAAGRLDFAALHIAPMPMLDF
jgi:hypothetical protein